MKKAKGITKVLLLVSLAIMFALSTIGTLDAATTIYEPTILFGADSVHPAGTDPVVRATFDDSYGGLNTVLLTMEALNLMGSENITRWFFNFNDSLDVTQLNIIEVGSSGIGSTTISKDQNDLKADGDGYYDFKFDFPPPPGGGSDRFNATNPTVSYAITYSDPIDVWDFDFDSSPLNSQGKGSASQGTYKTAVHIQSIACGGPGEPSCDGFETRSAWIGATQVVPEPVSSTLFIIGGAVLGGRAYRKRKKKQI